MDFIKILLSFFLCLVFLSSCAPAKPYSEPGPDYYSDLEYNNVDKRWYHKNQPSARDMTSYDTARDFD